MDAMEVLNAPFDFDVHNGTFICYCEVIVMPDGTIEYAVPSHVEFLERLYRESMGSEPGDDFGCMWGYMEWLLERTGCVAVWYDRHTRAFNADQRRSLKRLALNGCCDFGRRGI